MEVGLSLGSNLGDRLRSLSLARDRIAALAGVRIVASSGVHETDPVDVPPEFSDLKFLNSVLILDCALPIRRLAWELRAIEDGMGRVRGGKRNAPRTIDIDIIYADDVVIEEAELVLPHPRWAQRRFVVAPLREVRPELRLPGQQKTVREIFDALAVGDEKERPTG